MSDILDSYISKIDANNFSKKINLYINQFKFKKTQYLRLFFIKIKILRTSIDLKIEIFKLGKFISDKYHEENAIDFSYQDQFFTLNQSINRKKRYIQKLKNNV
tara:strand:- start:845 stop:1153 length:309 start_codon:yes stop_codon:yes gene_type:complete